MRARLLLLLSLVAPLAGCSSPHVDLRTALEIVDVSTGYFDMGVVNGQNKIVPSITYKLKNRSSVTLDVLQTNHSFKRQGEQDEWGNGYLKVTGREGLAPGETSRALTVRSQLGYTGLESRQKMLENQYFVDAYVRVLAKYNNAQWVEVGQFPIARRVLEP